jgi:hypothetical protein
VIAIVKHDDDNWQSGVVFEVLKAEREIGRNP